jgi:hypothetical protein
MSFAGRSLPRLTGPAERVGRHFDGRKPIALTALLAALAETATQILGLVAQVLSPNTRSL